MSNERTNERKIHVALPDDVHQRLRVKCALKDTTIQDYVSQLIAMDVGDMELPNESTKSQRAKPANLKSQRTRKVAKKAKASKTI